MWNISSAHQLVVLNSSFSPLCLLIIRIITLFTEGICREGQKTFTTSFGRAACPINPQTFLAAGMSHVTQSKAARTRRVSVIMLTFHENPSPEILQIVHKWLQKCVQVKRWFFWARNNSNKDNVLLQVPFSSG